MKRSISTKAESAASILPLTSNRQSGLLSREMISSIRSLPSCGSSSCRSRFGGEDDLASDPDLEDVDADRALGVDGAGELDLRHLGAVGVVVVDEDAVEQVRAGTALEHLAQARRVVADREASLDPERAADADLHRHRADQDRREAEAEARTRAERPRVVADERRVLAHQDAEDLAGVAEEREGEPADAERGAAAGCALVRGVVDRAVVGVAGEVVDQARLRVGCLRDPVGGRFRQRLVLGGALVRDVEAAALGAAERDQQVAVAGHRVDEADELQDRAQQREVVAAHRLEHVEHRHRAFADELGEVGDDRDLALEQSRRPASAGR